MTTIERFSAALWTLFATTSGFLLLGLFGAGFVHSIAHRLERWQTSVTRGFRAIGLGMLAGLPLPICSCGIVPLALGWRRRNAYPETAAAFVVSTPETSLDAIGLTAALLGLPFAMIRLLAGLTASFLAGVFVIASDVNAPAETPGPVEDTASHRDLPRWWLYLVERLRTLALDLMGRSLPPPADGATAPAEQKAHRVRHAFVHALRIGFIDTLDEISWTLLIGFVISALLLALLPPDFASRVPGGIAGQIVFGLAISLPLYVCASGSVPLVAALVAKGLSPVAALAIFLMGPVTNPAMLLLLRRSFGRRFIMSILIAAALTAVIFGTVIAALSLPATSLALASSDSLPQTAVGGWDVFFAIILLPLFVLSLARAGWKRAADDVRMIVTGIVPPEASRIAVGFFRHASVERRRLGAAFAILAVAAWLTTGLVVIPEGRVGFQEVFGKASQDPLLPGLHWIAPTPFGALKRVDSGAVVTVSVGYRPGGATFTSADSGWHSIYTSQDSRAEESAYVTGDLNMIESKASIHLFVTDPRRFAYRGGNAIEIVRSAFQASMRELLAARAIDDTLTTARGSIERASVAGLQQRLDALRLPLRVVTVNLLDLHPPDAAVHAFRDISSAAEDRETRIHKASGTADAALPAARGEAATMLAAAQSDRRENVARASGVSTAFAVQVDVARTSATAVRSKIRWDALERLFNGKRIVVVPHQTPRDLIDFPARTGVF